nr:hypothetical protein [Banfec virus 2]
MAFTSFFKMTQQQQQLDYFTEMKKLIIQFTIRHLFLLNQISPKDVMDYDLKLIQELAPHVMPQSELQKYNISIQNPKSFLDLYDALE